MERLSVLVLMLELELVVEVAFRDLVVGGGRITEVACPLLVLELGFEV